MVGGKRDKVEASLPDSKNRSKSIKGRPPGVKEKLLNIKEVRVESQLSNSEPQNTRLPCEMLWGATDTVEVIGMLDLSQISMRAQRAGRISNDEDRRIEQD